MSGNINPYPGQEGSPGHQKPPSYVGQAFQYEPVIAITTATYIPTIDQSSAWFTLNPAAATTITLPSTPTIGTAFTFIVETSCTGTNTLKVTTGSSSIFVQGTDFISTVGGGTTCFQANGSTHCSATFNGTTTGGLLGTIINVVCLSATLWNIQMQNFGSGTLATSFQTSP